MAVTYDLTKATLTFAWVIILNKPFYPLYVWYLVDADAAVASLVTVLSLPFFPAIPFLAKKSHLAARLALPLVGTLDTLFETAMFGHTSGTEFFFAACIMLAAISFLADEKLWQYAMAVLLLAHISGRGGAILVGRRSCNASQSECVLCCQSHGLYRASICRLVTAN
ncbi:hypothetical protein [Rhizobium sp. UGM030330-04]|uniref:hypothetical protein n=1 Tax=Rhizobium sp. UGM030330-04 TaxID=1378077 RepID=UPI000D9B5034|nr:hypothetical protein [Rhizobium sp. UGM030330-04]PYG54354.1 hypothetical protein N434_04615 [Rhizobium sp. UGM030330-04]